MKRFKFLCALLLMGCILLGSVTAVSAAGELGEGRARVYNQDGSHTRARVVEGEAYLPLYLFADSRGIYDYGWDFGEVAAYVRADGLSLTATPGNMYITVNGRVLYGEVLDFDGTVYVPVTALATAFGLDIDRNYDAPDIVLWGENNFCTPASQVYDSDEVFWLARIIQAESGGEPFLGKVAVGTVVLNRLEHPSYPDTVYEVIFDRKHGTQFTPVATGTIYNTPSEESYIAAKLCLEGYRMDEEILFFLNPRASTSFWIVRACCYRFTVGRHDFYA